MERGQSIDLSDEVCYQMAGWPTPDANLMNDGENLESFQRRQAILKKKHKNGNGAGMSIAVAVQMAGWGTPSGRDQKDHTARSCQNVEIESRLGRQVHLSNAETESCEGYLLNPMFSLWLMGYPIIWGLIGYMAVLKMKIRFEDFMKAILRYSKT